MNGQEHEQIKVCLIFLPPGPDHKRTLLVRRIEATDRQIDRQIFRAVRPDGRGDRDCGGWLAQVEAFGEGL
jgi:hypothetical protein